MKLKKYTDEERGRMTALAKAIGVLPSLMSMWVSGDRKVPIEWCLIIERATGGVVAAEELRPDFDWSRPHRPSGRSKGA